MMFADMTPDDVYALTVRRHDILWWLIVGATAFVSGVLAVQIAVKFWIFGRVIRSNKALADEAQALMDMVRIHAQITDAQKARTDRTLAKVDSAVAAVVDDHGKIDEVHKTVRRIDEKLPDSPSGVSSPGGP
jgi:hypothetical protein